MQGSLAKRLRVLRAERGLTLREAADRVNIRPATLSDIEHGHSRPHDVTLAKIAGGYGVPVEDLFEEPDLVGASGKAEAPASGTGRENLSEVLARLGSPTQYLADDALTTRTLKDATVEEVKEVSRAVRREAELLAPELRRRLEELEGKPGYMDYIVMWGEARKQVHALKWLLRDKQGLTLTRITPNTIPGEDAAEQGEAPEGDAEIERTELVLAGVR
jgi:transcriptional regulator with XRE-family HTH domain